MGLRGLGWAVTLALLMLPVITPYTSPRPLALIISVDRVAYSVGDEVNVTTRAFEAGRAVDLDDPPQVYVLSSTRIYPTQRVDRGVYTVDFPVVDRDGSDLGGLLVLVAQGNLRGQPLAVSLVLQVLPVLRVAVVADVTLPLPGQWVNFTISVLEAYQPVDLDELDAAVIPIAPGSRGWPLETRHTGVGSYRGAFMVPEGAAGQAFVVDVSARKGYSWAFQQETFVVQGLMVWAHPLNVSVDGMVVEAFISSPEGLPASGANILIEQSGGSIAAEATADDDGRALLLLPPNATVGGTVTGTVTWGSVIQRIIGTLPDLAPRAGLTLIPWPPSPLASYPTPGTADMNYSVYVDGQPLTHRWLTYTVATPTAILTQGRVRTGARGQFELQVPSPPGPISVLFQAAQGNTIVSSWEHLLGASPQISVGAASLRPGAVATFTIAIQGQTPIPLEDTRLVDVEAYLFPLGGPMGWWPWASGFWLPLNWTGPRELTGTLVIPTHLTPGQGVALVVQVRASDTLALGLRGRTNLVLAS